jgi:5-methylcytosine-specific restriction endonuclease McrA
MRDPEVVAGAALAGLGFYGYCLARVRRWWVRRARSTIARMGPAEVMRKRWALGARDGWRCQRCSTPLDPTTHHTSPSYPQVHHLWSWSRHKHLPWVNEMWNLCLLDRACNRAVGATTPLWARRLSRQLRARYRVDRPRRWRLAA